MAHGHFLAKSADPEFKAKMDSVVSSIMTRVSNAHVCEFAIGIINWGGNVVKQCAVSSLVLMWRSW